MIIIKLIWKDQKGNERMHQAMKDRQRVLDRRQTRQNWL